MQHILLNPAGVRARPAISATANARIAPAALHPALQALLLSLLAIAVLPAFAVSLSASLFRRSWAIPAEGWDEEWDEEDEYSPYPARIPTLPTFGRAPHAVSVEYGLLHDWILRCLPGLGMAPTLTPPPPRPALHRPVRAPPLPAPARPPSHPHAPRAAAPARPYCSVIVISIPDKPLSAKTQPRYEAPAWTRSSAG